MPANETKGYIIGYKVFFKLIKVGLEDVRDTIEDVIYLSGDHHSSYLIEHLTYFAMYRIYIIAYTVSGDSPKSNVVYAGK